MYKYSNNRSAEGELRIDNLVVVKVDSIRTYLEAKEQLKQLKALHDKMGETKSDYDSESDSVEEAIMAQAEQMDMFTNTRRTFNSQVFSKNLEVLLKRTGMKISDLEMMLNVSAGYISRAIGQDSKKRLSIDIAWEIADLFQINLDNLLNRDITTPTKDIKQVVSFIDKLIKDTDESTIHWEKQRKVSSESLWMFFSGSDSDKFFLPNAVPEECCVINNAYKVGLNIGDFYFFQALNILDENEYSMYLWDESLFRDSHGEAESLVQILISTEDSSGILDAECRKLMNTVKTHEKDFVVSIEAKRLMNKYISGYISVDDDDESLPFA